MDIDEQITYNHLFLSERECRTCGETKNLIDGFYLTRKERVRVAGVDTPEKRTRDLEAVSYTHLTLPTSQLV